MYLQRNTKQGRKNSFPKALLVESYWDPELHKSRKRTIANLSKYPDSTIDAIELALKHSADLSLLGSVKDVQISSGVQFGPQFVAFKMLESLGIVKVLGKSHQAKLAIWQIVSRIVEQGSRLSAVRLARDTASDELLDFEKPFCEDDLYRNLAWLAENQEEIENKLFLHRGVKACNLFLYDVTSSYLEGECNELADYGYNRDKKAGKMQIVIGLLTDEEGLPVSIEVFSGNTSDPKTLDSQIKKLAERFNCKNVVLVGDKGMIKKAGIESLSEKEFNFITTITKPQIETLLKNDTIQIGLFDDELVEVKDGELRYILRKNPVRALEMQRTRQSKIEQMLEKIDSENKKLKAKIEGKLGSLQESLERLQMHRWAELKAENNTIKLEMDDRKREEEGKLDGCYVVKTDLKDDVEMTTIHERYKDLALVEAAFRSMKTVELELRPVYVIKEKSTRGHLLVVMLAYMVMKELSKRWVNLDLTVSEGIERLKGYSTVFIEAVGGRVHKVPKADGVFQELLEPLGLTPPAILPTKKFNLLTRKSLVSEG